MTEPKNKGYIQVFTGEGKGKTSVALGMIMRAAGYGLKCHITFFLKGKHELGEYKTFSKLSGVEWGIYGRSDFLGPKDITPLDRKLAAQALEVAAEALNSGRYDLVIWDEINVATAWKLLDLEQVLEIVRNKPPQVELVLTGRFAATETMALADLVTEMKNVKHPFDSGLPARQGIDY